MPILRSHGLALAALMLAVSVFLSRILGLIREKVISYYFGTSAEADIYFTAFVVPDFLNYLLAGGYFSITLVPLLAKAFLENEYDGWKFFSAAVCWATLAIACCTAIAWIFAPTIAEYIAPGFSAEKTARLSHFLRIILPAQVCFLPGACFTAILYYRKQFTIPALTPLVYNGFIIVMGIIWVWLFPDKGMEGFCWGVLAGAFAGSLLMPFFGVRCGTLQFIPNLMHPRMKVLFFLALPLMLGQSIVVLDEQFIRIFGSMTEEGGVSLLNYARRIMQVPVGVIAQAAGIASFPFLAALVAEKKIAEFTHQLNTALTSTVLIAVPVSFWMMVSGSSIMQLIFQQGSFSAEAARTSGILLVIMLASVTFWVIQQIIGRAFYAVQDTLTPALTGTVATILTLPFYWFGAQFYGVYGVALAGSAAISVYTTLLCLIWIRRFGNQALANLLRYSMSASLACLPACGAVYMCTQWLSTVLIFSPVMSAAIKIGCGSVLFGAIYLTTCKITAPALCLPITHAAQKIANKLRRKKLTQ